MVKPRKTITIEIDLRDGGQLTLVLLDDGRIQRRLQPAVAALEPVELQVIQVVEQKLIDLGELLQRL